MFNIPTPHLEASSDDIAKTVIMPGDLHTLKTFSDIGSSVLDFFGIHSSIRGRSFLNKILL